MGPDSRLHDDFVAPPTRGSTCATVLLMVPGRIQVGERFGIEPGVEQVFGGGGDRAADDDGGRLARAAFICVSFSAWLILLRDVRVEGGEAAFPEAAVFLDPGLRFGQRRRR